MKVIDLTPGYISHVIRDDNFYKYEELYPALFKHYYKYWAKREAHKSVYPKNEIDDNRKLVIKTIKQIFPVIKKFDGDIKSLEVVLFVGDGGTNGHAFYDEDHFVVWLPVETYKNETDALVFITHEIIHALHYLKSEKFYFNNVKQKNHLGRQIITEGLAGYLTMKIHNLDEAVALWGSYLKPKTLEKWMADCYENLNRMEQIVYEKFNYDDDLSELFIYTSDDDVTKNRGGYFIGMKIIERLVNSQKIKQSELLSIDRDEFEALVKDLLSNPIISQ